MPIIHLPSLGRRIAVAVFGLALLSHGGLARAQSRDHAKPGGGKSQWDVYTYVNGSGPFPSKANPLPGGVASFDFLETPDRALLVTESSFYRKTLLGNQTGGTVSAMVAISSAPGTTFNYYGEGDPACPRMANVRLYLATNHPKPIKPSCPGVDPAEHGALWWSNPVSFDLATINNTAAMTLQAPLDPSQWSDTCGHFGNFDAAHLAAFQTAVSHIDQIGLSFGGGCNFAFGDGSEPAGATFELLSYTVSH